LEEGSFTYSGIEHATQFGHDYSTLFGQLNVEHREYLSVEFKVHFKSQTLSSVLESFDGTFIKWRYSYEKKGKKLNITELLNLSRFLVEAISKMNVSYS